MVEYERWYNTSHFLAAAHHNVHSPRARLWSPFALNSCADPASRQRRLAASSCRPTGGGHGEKSCASVAGTAHHMDDFDRFARGDRQPAPTASVSYGVSDKISTDYP
jgi:hypothetical protein